MTGDARRHAETASSLLAGAASYSERLASLTADERLEMAVAGGFSAANADLRWTVELAIAHALTSIALEVTDDGLET